MTPLSLPRLYALRAAFLLMGAGLAVVQWPTLGDHARWSLFQGVAKSMFVALSVLGLLGVRHPVRLLPVLLVEIGWKAVWLAVVAFPAWRSGAMDGDVRATLIEVAPIVVVAAVVPWGYVVRTYVTAPGERWLPESSSGDGPHPSPGPRTRVGHGSTGHARR